MPSIISELARLLALFLRHLRRNRWAVHVEIRTAGVKLKGLT